MQRNEIHPQPREWQVLKSGGFQQENLLKGVSPLLGRGRVHGKMAGGGEPRGETGSGGIFTWRRPSEDPAPPLATARLLPSEPRTRTVLAPPPMSDEPPGKVPQLQREKPPPSATPVTSSSSLVPPSLGDTMAAASFSSPRGCLAALSWTFGSFVACHIGGHHRGYCVAPYAACKRGEAGAATTAANTVLAVIAHSHSGRE